MFSKPFFSKPFASALALTALASVTIVTALLLQALGYPPCDLCLQQRYAYYASIPAGLLIAVSAGKAPAWIVKCGFGLVALMFVGNAGLAIYHSGVEAHLWRGPGTCAGGPLPPAGGDLLKAIAATKVVRCDDVGLRVLGLSLANWNVAVSLTLAALSTLAAACTPADRRP